MRIAPWPTLLACLAAVPLAACEGGGDGNAAITYWRDVKPILDARCIRCHVEGGIGPFPLGTYDEVYAFRGRVHDAVGDRIMPPWQVSPDCNEYDGDFSLTGAQIATIVGWVDIGAPEGDPMDEPPPLEVVTPDLARVDVSLAPPDPYTPQDQPDEYRCFVMDWPEATTTYVTGFRATPGMRAIVHHVIAYLVAPGDEAGYLALDAGEAGPGYTCFGGPGGNASMLGVWAPGIDGRDYPEGTGLLVEPGSKVVMQIHYNTLDEDPVPDLTTLDFSIEPTVVNRAYLAFWGDPSWGNGNMPIPAGDPDVMHAFSAAPSDLFGIPLALRVWMAALHMHTRGSRGTLEIRRTSGASECTLDIPRWDFHWQNLYELEEPQTIYPGDEFSIECHWDNSAANQPEVDGVPVAPMDLNWGEGTTDEMCLGVVYVSL